MIIYERGDGREIFWKFVYENGIFFHTKWHCEVAYVYQSHIQGGPKITERHTSGNKDIGWLVSVDGVSSPEKNDTKISHFG